MVGRYSFPVATHSYFRAVNKKEQEWLFLTTPGYSPIFKYDDTITPGVIAKRIEAIHPDDDYTRRRLTIVKASLELRKDATTVNSFRVANEHVYHAPTRRYAGAILNEISNKVSKDTVQLWSEVLELLGVDSFNDYVAGPTEEIFTRYANYLSRYIALPDRSLGLIEALNQQLEVTNLRENGWSIRLNPGEDHARVKQQARIVCVGEDYVPRASGAATRIAVHEVLGHALRGPQNNLAESEGFAILLEQLTGSRFGMRRSYRYLAVALGWGVFKAPMNFIQVHDILWRVMAIFSKYPVDVAKKYAFDECYRAFRGGRPDVAGAVYLKDSVYFEANMRMWEVLSRRPLTYNEFIDCIEGKREVLV